MAHNRTGAQRLATAQDLERLNAQQHVLNLAVTALAQDVEYLSDVLVDAGILADRMDEPEGPEPDDDEPDLLDQQYEVADSYPPDFVPDVVETPEEVAKRRRDIAEARRALRAQAEQANEADDEDLAALDNDLNTITDVPEEGIEVTVPGREPRAEGDIDPRL